MSLIMRSVARIEPNVEPIRKRSDAPVALHAHALDNLRYIRETMERAGSFTAVPGWGGVAMGATALAAAGLASHASSRRAWMACWLLEGVVAWRPASWPWRRKARAAGLPVWNAPARKFRVQFRSARDRGSRADPGSVAGGRLERDSRRVADALRQPA